LAVLECDRSNVCLERGIRWGVLKEGIHRVMKFGNTALHGYGLYKWPVTYNSIYGQCNFTVMKIMSIGQWN